MHDQTAENSSQHTSQNDDKDIPLETWESNPGTIAGQVVCWYPDYEFNPPTQAELADVEAKQLAISAAAVTNVGVVDLPPSSKKRRKNSHKMFITFFVHFGHVFATVN